ncbi:alpha/beta fold hydrolase [Streptomyces sp. NPDC002845]
MTSSTGHVTTADGTHLAYRAHTPPHASGSDVLLLHGLAGHLGEWNPLLPLLLADGHRVVTYDARGHGASTRRPRDMSRGAAVGDAVTLIEALALPPVTLIGQSLGGHTALLTAAAHPGLVRALVLIEAGPGGPTPDLPSQISAWLDTWPTPFDSPASAREFFGHEAWAQGLEEREDGWHPRLDRDRMIEAVRELATHDYWDVWSRVRCPALVVRGESGTMPPTEFAKMKSHRPETECLTIQDASHDVHLDQPKSLHAAIGPFVENLP